MTRGLRARVGPGRDGRTTRGVVDMTKTERIARLEKEVAEAWGWVEVYEVEGAFFAERCLKAEGREGDVDARVELLIAAHEESRPHIPAAI